MMYDNIVLVKVIIYKSEKSCFCDKLMLRNIKIRLSCFKKTCFQIRYDQENWKDLTVKIIQILIGLNLDCFYKYKFLAELKYISGDHRWCFMLYVGKIKVGTTPTQRKGLGSVFKYWDVNI